MLQLMLAEAWSDRWFPSVTLRVTVWLPAAVKVNAVFCVVADWPCSTSIDTRRWRCRP
jgi:hypothetical protein